MVVYRLAGYQQLLIYNRGISGEEVLFKLRKMIYKF